MFGRLQKRPIAMDPDPRDVEIDDEDDNDPSETDDGAEMFFEDSEDDEQPLPADPYAELRADPDLPADVLAEMIEQDDKYIEAYGKALREHFSKPRR
jgi:hypothetical protein